MLKTIRQEWENYKQEFIEQCDPELLKRMDDDLWKLMQDTFYLAFAALLNQTRFIGGMSNPIPGAIHLTKLTIESNNYLLNVVKDELVMALQEAGSSMCCAMNAPDPLKFKDGDKYACPECRRVYERRVDEDGERRWKIIEHPDQ